MKKEYNRMNEPNQELKRRRWLKVQRERLKRLEKIKELDNENKKT